MQVNQYQACLVHTRAWRTNATRQQFQERDKLDYGG
jgi:hypothetical protein